MSIKKLIFIFLLLFKYKNSNAQINLVVNPSFENYTSCPDQNGCDISKAVGWDTALDSPDFFHTCAASNYCKIPKNWYGFQYPSNGNGYCGLVTYALGNNREIIVGQLSSPLVVSQSYSISFKACLANEDHACRYSTNKLGVKFSKVKQSNVSVNNFAHFYSNSIITDTLNWTTISGVFVADSAYNYIMLGNFFDDANTSIIDNQIGYYAYYYIDEVNVSLFNESTDIKNYYLDENVIFYPNPVNDYFTINLDVNDNFKIFNSLGLEVIPDFDRKNKIVNCADWPNGLYFIKTKKRTFKLIVVH